MNLDIGVIAVITSALVALSSTLVPLINESIKWKRDRKTAELEKIDQRTVELFENLSIYRSGNVYRATGRSDLENYSKLLSRYYAWENVVLPWCKDMDPSLFSSLRSKIEDGDEDSISSTSPKLAHEIMLLTQHANEKI